MVDTQLPEAEEQLVVFELSMERYGVEIGRVQEISGSPPLLTFSKLVSVSLRF